MSTKLVGYEHIIAELSKTSELYAKFSELEIHGTLYCPLFIARDIEKLVEVDLQIVEKYRLVWDYERRSDGTIMLTELGLYDAMDATYTQIAHSLKCFVSDSLYHIRKNDAIKIEAKLAKLEYDLQIEKSIRDDPLTFIRKYGRPIHVHIFDEAKSGVEMIYIHKNMSIEAFHQLLVDADFKSKAGIYSCSLDELVEFADRVFYREIEVCNAAEMDSSPKSLV